MISFPYLQHLSWEAIQPHLEIWIWKILETVSPPASSSCSPAPSPRATASSDSRLVSSCFLRMVRTSPPHHRPQDPPPPPQHRPQDPPHPLHPLQTGLTNQATQKRLALPRGREKCQKVSYNQNNATFVSPRDDSEKRYQDDNSHNNHHNNHRINIIVSQSNAPGRSSNATSTQRPASKDTPTAWPAMIVSSNNYEESFKIQSFSDDNKVCADVARNPTEYLVS